MAKPPAKPIPAASKPRDRVVTALLSAAAVASLVSLAFLATRLVRPVPRDPIEVLRLAAAQYVAGDPIVAGELAATVDLGPESPLPPDPYASIEDGAAPPQEASAAIVIDPNDAETAKDSETLGWRNLQHFLVGAGNYARAADVEDHRGRRRLRMDAIDHLSRVAEAGFPPGRRAAGHEMLGDTLLNLGRYEESLEHLQEAIRLDPTRVRTLRPSLAEAQRKCLPPRTKEALQTIDAFLATPLLPADLQYRGEQIRLSVLMDLRRYDDAGVLAKEILARSPTLDAEIRPWQESAREHAMLALAETGVRRIIDAAAMTDDIGSLDDPKIRQLWKDSSGKLLEISRSGSPRVNLMARLWAARLNRVVGRDDAALASLSEVRQHRPLGAVGTMAGLEEVELLAELGRGVELLQTTRYLVREIEDPTGFHPELISLDNFQTRLMIAIDALLKHGEYESAIETAKALPPLFSEADSLVGQGRGYAAWAGATEDVGPKIAKDRETARQARQRYRAAGDALSAAADRLFGTEDYVQTQWAAIEAYQSGRHFSRSIECLQPYLRYEDRRRQSRGLIAMGRALLAVGRPQDAIDALQTCIVEQPRDPLRYDARLMLAVAQSEVGLHEPAKKALQENLNDGSLTPQSPAWRNSLFALADILYRTAKQRPVQSEVETKRMSAEDARQWSNELRETLRYLDESVARYWPSEQAEDALYKVAMTHRMSALASLGSADQENILEAAKRNLISDADSSRRMALATLDRLANHLLAREDDGRLSPASRQRLRNALMLRGDVMRELGRFDDAASAYRQAELRYINTPVSLEAIMRRSDCMRQLGRTDQADLLIRQAEVALARIGSQHDSQFATVTRYDRRGWEDYLRWLSGRLAGA